MFDLENKHELSYREIAILTLQKKKYYISFLPSFPNSATLCIENCGYAGHTSVAGFSRFDGFYTIGFLLRLEDISEDILSQLREAVLGRAGRESDDAN